MNTSNKLLLGLLLTVVAFITVMIGTAKFYEQERKAQEGSGRELIAPPAPPAPPATPPAPALPGN
ncbi:hypothetical protein [Pontibacter liquoris]|uniref:hypothetical protein n=1 Tax=Pontibacter liquoris TaxID=2905677 RepID=UPI001FA729C5|nr:hypothetical protein [Pontibacter liquoris]